MKRTIVSFLKVFCAVFIALVFVVSVSGCAKEEGPMEKAGKKVDEAVDATKETATKTGEAVKEGAVKTKEAVKEGAEKASDAVKDTTKK